MRTFSVVTEAHLSLTEANGIFALADAIELLKFCLVDTLKQVISLKQCYVAHWQCYTDLARKVKFEGFDADVVGSRSHCVRILSMYGIHEVV